jgi:light-regulated signal transduction histidine kinase (bacteriophytochrome)
MMWFRPEMIETVKWAGDPKKPVEIETLDTETRLLPRTSFALWKEEVRGRSVPWCDFEIEAVRGLRHALIEIVVDRAHELASLNRELAQSNIELDSFAYVASHDLKEPVRGIHNYSVLLQQSAQDRLSETEKARLDTILRLTVRMDDLIESLLQYSRVGRVDMALRPVDLNQVVREALDLLGPRIAETAATIQVGELPTVVCDRVRIREVFFNLILNALKYNDRKEKRVEVGFLEMEGIFFVRDNGIGIEAENFEDIFRIFKRLHGRDEYGGGTGTGLTIARKVVERHGGRMWVESTPYVGSKFCFTLPAPQAPPSEENH